jgi:hypothetical protein
MVDDSAILMHIFAFWFINFLNKFLLIWNDKTIRVAENRE